MNVILYILMTETKCTAVGQSATKEKNTIKVQLRIILILFAIAIAMYKFLKSLHETAHTIYFGYVSIYIIYIVFILIGIILIMDNMTETLEKMFGFKENLIVRYYFLLVLIMIINHIIYYISNNKTDYSNVGNQGTFGYTIKTKLYPLAHLLMYNK